MSAPPGITKGVVTLVSGTAFAQVISIAALPLLTRLYGPVNFGLLSIYASMLAVVAVIASLKLEVAIPLQKDSQRAKALTALTIRILVINAFLCLMFVVFLREWLAAMIGEPDLAKYLWFLPLGLLSIGAYQIASNFALREKQFASISITKLKQAVAMVFVQIVGAPFQASGLILGNISGQALGATELLRKSGVGARDVIRLGMPVGKLLSEQWRFPAFTSISALVNTVGAQVPTVYIASQFGVVSAGIYGMAEKTLFLPASLISTALANVLYSEMARHDRRVLGETFKEVHRVITRITCPAVLFAALVLPDLFGHIFGKAWVEGGRMAAWISVWVAAVVTCAPFGNMLFVLNKQKAELVFQSAMLIARMSALILAARSGDLLVAVASFSVVSALSWVAYVLWLSNVLQVGLKSVLVHYATSILMAIALCMPIIANASFSLINRWGAVAVTGGCLLLYYVHCLQAYKRGSK